MFWRAYNAYGHTKLCVHVHNFFLNGHVLVKILQCEPWICEFVVLSCAHPAPAKNKVVVDRGNIYQEPDIYTVTMFPQMMDGIHRKIFNHTSIFHTKWSETHSLIFHFVSQFPVPASCAMPWVQGWRQGRWWLQRVSMVVVQVLAIRYSVLFFRARHCRSSSNRFQQWLHRICVYIYMYMYSFMYIHFS